MKRLGWSALGLVIACGGNTVTSPTVVSASPPAISAGNAGSCLLLASGTVRCWGAAVFGTPRTPPIAIDSTVRFVALSAGSNYACALDATGAAYCWGWNSVGQLGDGTGTSSTSPVRVAGGHLFTSIAAGQFHACALTAAGAAFCWGQNTFGQFGDGTTAGSLAPTPAAGGLTLRHISAGADHTCAIGTDNQMYCWGANTLGQLGGTASTTPSTSPVVVSLGQTWSAVSAGDRYTCAIAATGAAWCWGDSSGGKLGVAFRAGLVGPVQVAGSFTFVSISTASNHTCGLSANGAAYCWGTNSYGQLGDGMAQNVATTPVVVTGGLTFRSLAAGAYLYSDESHNEGTSGHTCGVTTAGDVYCWGDNLVGQLGAATPPFSGVPVKVSW